MDRYLPSIVIGSMESLVMKHHALDTGLAGMALQQVEENYFCSGGWFTSLLKSFSLLNFFPIQSNTIKK